MPCSHTHTHPRPQSLVRSARALLGSAFFVLLLAGCGSDAAPGSAQIRSASVVSAPAPVLDVALRLRFTPTMLEALDHGIPLVLELALEGRDAQRTLRARSELTLSYLPLAEQYRIAGDGGARSFARRTQLLAALDRVRVPLDAQWAELAPDARYELGIALDNTRLPGPLRLPALFSREWRLATTEHAWPAAR